MAGARVDIQDLLDLFETDDDDLDQEYEPAAGTTDEEESGESEYTDAQEDLGSVEIEFSVVDSESQDNGDDEGEETETEATATNTGPTTISIEQINHLLASHGPLRRLLLSHYRAIQPQSSADEDGDEIFPGYGGRRRRRMQVTGEKFPKIPSERGQELQNSGTYGQRDHFMDIRRKRKSNLSERLMWRRLGVDARGSMRRQNRLIAQEMVPNSRMADKIIHYDSRAYSGQFSDDGNFFFSCTQNFKVRMYDTSNPYEWKYYKTVDYPFGQWTITDATLSPDNKFLAYSSIRHMVCLAPTDPSDHSEHTHLDFTQGAGGTRGSLGYMGRHGFGIWSLRFSGDGREIVAGTSDHCVVVYDLERRQTVLKLQNHDDDVNAVCFGDKSSPHILYSGSDDQTLRVWDRRSMGDGREAGVFVGHTEGITYVDSKGDGRYVLSNGKDQMMKLWDLRKMVSPSKFDTMNLRQYTSNFDYRFTPYDAENDYRPNPDDCSIVTFRGHSVLKTLIRCHFSPPGSSNSRYVYSGSEDGKVWIWNLDGTVKRTIDVGAATKNTRPRTSAGGESYPYELHSRHSNTWTTCVRDASWSPTVPVLAATSWNGWGMTTGTVTLHSWGDNEDDDEAEPFMGSNYNCRLDMRKDYDQLGRSTRSREGGRGLRSNVVRPARLGMDADGDDDEGGW